MKAKSILGISLLGLLVFSACEAQEWKKGQGDQLTETRQVSGFDQIRIHHSADVDIIRDTFFSVEVRDYENIVQYTETDLRGKTLYIKKRDHVHIRNSRLYVRITMPDLQDVRLSGSGNVHLFGNFANLAAISISGSGNIQADYLNTQSSLSLDISGSGKIEMAGTAPDVDATISGSGKLNLLDLNTDRFHCRVSGSGKAYVNVNDYLEANISGSGSIYYTGQPIIESKISGSGKIRKY